MHFPTNQRSRTTAIGLAVAGVLCLFGAASSGDVVIQGDFNVAGSPTVVDGSIWNPLDVAPGGGAAVSQRNFAALLDSTGASTGVSLDIGNTGQEQAEYLGAGGSDLYRDYLYLATTGTTKITSTATFSGLTVNGRYNLLLYGSADGTSGEDTDFSVINKQGNFSLVKSTSNPGTQYVSYQNVEPNAAGEIVATWGWVDNAPSGAGEDRTPFDGFMLTEVDPGPTVLPTDYMDSVVIQVEDYVRGHDLNTGGINKLGVDVTSWIQYIYAGEWVEYEVMTVGGAYDLRVRLASPASGHTLTALVDGSPVAALEAPFTGSWSATDYTEWTAPFMLSPGQHTIRLEMTNPRYNLDWFEIRAVPEPTSAFLLLLGLLGCLRIGRRRRDR